MKKITLLLFALFSCWQISAQVSVYSFSQSNETYTEITGGTVLGTAAAASSFDAQNWTIADGSIPFSFNFNGTSYTGCTVNSNGYVTFGTTAPLATSGSPISSTTAYAGAISAWGGDLNAVFIANLITSETRWEVVGDAPNREFVIQFKNWRTAFTASVTDVAFINFQIRLVEGSNLVKIVYGPNGYAIGSAVSAATRQIGLRGATNTDFKTRTNTTLQLFTASTAGTANSSSQSFNTNPTVVTPGMPPSGLVYTFTPPTPCSGTPVATTVLPVNQNLNTTQPSASISVQQYAEGTSGLTYQWEQSIDGGANWANVTTGTGGTTRTYFPVAFAGTNISYRAKVTCTASGSFEYSSVSTITNCSGVPVTTLPWNEGFEGLTTIGATIFPQCWFKQNGDWTSANAPSSYSTARTGTNYIRNSWSATNEFIWTPGFVLTEGVSYDFSSYVQGDNGPGWVVEYFVHTTNSSTSGTPVQLGAPYNPPSEGTTYFPGPYVKVRRSFTPTTTGTYYFAVRVNQPSGAPWYVSFDDFRVEQSPTCIEPTAVVNSNVTSDSANISWTAPAVAPASGYEYIVSTVNQLPTTAGIATTATTLSLTALLPNTTYHIFVRSNCGSDNFSTWAGPTSFTTFLALCPPVTAFQQNFDSVIAAAMPECWVKLGPLGTCATATGTLVNSAPNAVIFSGLVNAAPTMRMPTVSNLGAGTHRIKFYMRNLSTTVFPNIDFGYLTNPFDASSFVTLTSFVAATGTAIYDFTPPAGTYSNYPAMKMNGTVYGTVYFDDISWEPIPTCLEPTLLTATGITNSSANLGWTDNTSASAWEIQYGAPGFTLGTGTIVPVDSNPFTLNGLTADSNYAFFVRAVCSDTDSSTWTGPFTFRTQCNDVDSFVENFDTTTTGGTNMPGCWGRLVIGAPTVNVSSGSTLPMSPSNRLFLSVSSTATPAQEGYAVLRPVSNLSAGTHRLRFKAFATAAGRVLEVGYLTDPSNLATFMFLTDIQLPSTTVANTQQFTIVPVDVPVGVKHLAIKNPGFPGGTSLVYIDDVVWEPIPSCVEPIAPVVSGVLATSATLNWTAPTPAPAEGYEYYYSTTNTTPGANPDTTTGTLGSVGAGITTATLTALAPTTQYYVWVRSVCSTTDKSAWTTIVTFTTPCASFVPDYLEPFDTWVPANGAPTCWTRFGAGTLATGPTGPVNTGSWTQDGYLNSGSTGAIKVNLYSNFIVSWLVSPVFDLTAGGYQVKYNVGATVWNGTTATLMGSDDNVYFRMSTDGGATWTTLETFNSTNTPSNLGTTKTYNIPTVTSNNVKFAFFATDGTVDDLPDYDFFIDHFEIQLIPSEAPVCATNVTAVANASCGNEPTAISWNAAAGADGYKVYISTTAGGTATATPITVGSTTYSYVGALNTTYYYKVVPFNVTGDATGCAEQSFSTALNGCHCIPSSTSTSDYISNFSTTNAAVNLVFPNASMSPGGYGNNYNTQSISHFADSSFNFSNTYVGGTNGLRIWVDWNNNFIFEDSEVVFYLLNSNLTKTGTINVPAGTANGDYRMRVRAQWGATADPSACGSITWGEALDFKLIIDNSLSTSGFDATSFKVYPNPVTDILTVSYSNEISEIVVYNLLGQQVLAAKPNATQTQMDLSGLNAGTYMVKVTSDEESKTVKVVKN